MQQLISVLKKSPEFSRLLERVETAALPAAVNGLSAIHKAHFSAALRRLTGRPVVCVLADELSVQRALADLEFFSGESVSTLPQREPALYSADSVSRDWERRRVRTLYRAATGAEGFFALSLEALSARTMPKQLMMDSVVRLRVGMEYELEEILEQLSALGYRRCRQVEGEGQFALRGGILDFYSPGSGSPVRAEFFGDELDSMGFFDTETQRRTENIEDALILPAAETLPQLHPHGTEGLVSDIRALAARQKRRKAPHEALIKTLEADAEALSQTPELAAIDRYMALIYPEMTTALDYFPAETLFVLWDHRQTAQRSKNRTEELGMELDSLLQAGQLAGELCEFEAVWEELCRGFETRDLVYLDSFPGGEFPRAPRSIETAQAKQLPSYGGSLDTAVSDLMHYKNSGFSSIVLCGSPRRAELLREMLAERGVQAGIDTELKSIPKAGQLSIALGQLSSGVEYTQAGLVILTEGQLSAPRRRQKTRTKSSREKIKNYADLSPGDLVVHEHHGIGRFAGIEPIELDGTVRDYIRISYAGTDRLFVPVTQLDLVSKYIGGGENSEPRLSKLGGDGWTKTRARAKAAAKELAGGLIALYAERKRRSGHAFAPDDAMQREFEDSFEYEETEDQLRCIVEIKQDMESSIPMDRLLCGDVGFGKTEVALRAVMKCVLDGKQAAILAPTTVLSQQHYMTMLRRFSGFPVEVDVMNRFRSPAQHKRTLRNLERGLVDVVVGTHRLFQNDVKFKDLGLLVVDEEQRFGVSHKEKLKELARQVDVLTLSATPIPRTLNMALSGIRDMSTLEEPPQGRHPVRTYVMEHSWTLIADAMRRELARGGQVYYLHNRIENIDRIAARIEELCPDAVVAVAHGRMNEDQLSGVMQQMSEGEIQILVCTTIIETGIDIPNVNTLIVDNADRMGLAQLHQLRGRVGRSSRNAYAYLTFSRGKELSEVAEKRLSAIREFAEFGSGFKIAMRDLEIRGAGNILGAEQSGHMMSVGYDMYLKLLEEAVLEEKGEKPPEPRGCSADIIISANIPERYVPGGEDRMDLYRRIAAIRSEEDADELTDELIDRFGEPPRSVNALISIALLRADAAAAGFSDITQKGGSLSFTLRPDELELAAVSAVCANAEYKERLRFIATGKAPCFTLKLRSGDNVLKLARAFIDKYSMNLQKS